MQDLIQFALDEAASGLDNLRRNPATLARIEAAGKLLADTFRSGHKVISCGNGGSMSDAIHFAEELSGRFRGNRAALPAMAISDPGHLTCTANDFGYDHVFARFVEAHLRAGDVLLGISTSGRSPNVIRAAETCHKQGGKVIILTGREGSELGALADIEIATPAGRFADRVQELHIKVIHILIELVEKSLFEK